MPDWKDEVDYAFTKDLTPEGWAWEFLRRNETYKSDFETVSKILSDATDIYGSNRAKWPREKPAFKFTPPREEGETVKAWRARCAMGQGEPPRIVPVDQWYGRKWGLRDRIVDPCSAPEAGVKFAPPPEYARLTEKVDDLEGYVEEVETDDGGGLPVFTERIGVVIFDLRYPLPKQVRLARGRLKRRQRELVAAGKVHVEATKTHQSKWTQYLRTLDGKSAGAPAPFHQ